MTSVWDAIDYLKALWSLWVRLGSARALGVEARDLTIALGRDPLFTAEDAAAFDAIKAKVKAEGLDILTEGGTRVLTPEDVHPEFSAWIDEA